MSDTVIKVEDIGKLYKLGEISTGTLSHDLNRWWAKVRGKEDPFAKVGQVNDRTAKGTDDYVWALKDISFEVKQGEVLGIIGRNGAGKSTLLKILSKVTTPTTGKIKIKGRIASLLEVGTGFHPELTGKENVFLNGAILGMNKWEIKTKFDEIVDFAGVEKYIDTPVKRYSSGMYVRLAFAVAAFLEPEILIIDEVLAVGDAEFQKKCLGRMKDVSVNDGRTVLFVSHNMGVIAQLCRRSVILKNGSLLLSGITKDVIEAYLASGNTESSIYRADKQSILKENFFEEIKTTNFKGDITENFQFDENIFLNVKICIKNYNPSAKISFTLQNVTGDYLSTFVEDLSNVYKGNEESEFIIKLQSSLIAPNSYYFRLAIFIPNGHVFDLVEMICPIKIFDSGTDMSLFADINYGSFTMNYEIV